MKRRFNITGLCNRDLHFTADVSDKLAGVMEMVEAGDYFHIHRPRQYGKTTLLFLLQKALLASGKFTPIKISFEGIDAPVYQRNQLFIETFLDMIKWEFESLNKTEPAALINGRADAVGNFIKLDKLLDELNRLYGPLVLMIDEVDNSANNQLFADFLGLLRRKFLKRNEGQGHTFHSVILAGVHDIKTLKIKIRPDEIKKYNSPWNIAAPFDIEMEFNEIEITSMLHDYSNAQGVAIDIPAVARRIFYYTSGHPFLVSYICKLLDEKVLPGGKIWKTDDVDRSVNLLLREKNTNFDALTKNIENNPELYDFIKSIAVEGASISFHVTDNLVSLAETYGMLGEENDNCKIHNRIYEQLLHNHMTLKLVREKKVEKISRYNITGNFINAQGGLNFELVLSKFQEFMKEQYSQKDRDFLERNGRLVFQAFLKPIINGSGFDFKEAQASEERRMDIVVTFGNNKYIVELKLWRGQKAHQRGLKQLADYLERTHTHKGYLVIFDSRKNTKDQWTQETVTIDDKEIFIVSV